MHKLGNLISTYKTFQYIALMIKMGILCYESGKLMMTTPHYNSGNDDDNSDKNKDNVCLLLIKMRFSELYIRSRFKSNARLLNYKSCDHKFTIIFFFGVSSDKQVIVKSYLQLGKKPFNSIRKEEKNKCFHLCKKPPSPVKKIR